VVVALAVAHLVGDRVAGALERVHAHDRGEQGGAHDSTDPGGRALVQRGDDAVRAVHPCEEVADGHADAHRRLRVRSGERHQSALALGDLVVPGAAALGAVVAEPADGQHDEAGVELVQAFDGEAEPVEHAGPEVLDEDVPVAHQPREHVAPVVGLEVEGDRLLVAVARQEVGGHRVVLRTDERWSPAA
jgi:hypothetical protein